MLTADKILKELESGKIEIEPFNIDQLNPNSYNCKLGNTLKVYKLDHGGYLDANKENPYDTINIPDDGIVLQPGVLYIANIVERVKTDHYISAIDGRSSIGRLGISIHATAGFGDIGFNGHYTLEIFCIHPVKIYKGTLIGQVYFETPEGEVKFLYNGRYQNQVEPTTSKMNISSKTIKGYHYDDKN